MLSFFSKIDMPLASAMSVDLGGNVVVCGGHTHALSVAPVLGTAAATNASLWNRDCFGLLPNLKGWRIVGRLPAPLSGAATAQIGPYAFIIGGYSPRTEKPYSQRV